MERYPALGAAKAPRPEPLVVDQPPAASRLPRRLMALGVLALVGMSVAAGWGAHALSRGDASADDPLPGRIDQKAVAVAYVDTMGGVRALSPTQPGRVKALPVPEGKEVPAGTVLLQIDDDLPRADLARAELDLDAAQERLINAHKLPEQRALQIKAQEEAIAGASAKLREARAHAEKTKRLFTGGKQGGNEDVEAANALVEGAQALVRGEQAKLDRLKSVSPSSAIRLAEIDVQEKQKQVEKAQVAVDECQVKAPARGKILRTLINVGELLGPAAKGPALQFCPSGDRIVRAEVEQEYAARVHVGQKATVQDDVTGTGEWAGEVIGVSDWYTQRRDVRLEPMQFNDVRTLEVLIRLKDEGGPRLRINQRVRVRLDGAE